MKKSICLILVLFGVINAKPSRFALKQVVCAIESLDGRAVTDLVNKYEFQKEPDLLERLVLCAHDVMDEQKGLISLGASSLDVLSLVAGIGGALFSVPLICSSWFGLDIELNESGMKLGGTALLALSLYLCKRGIFCDAAKKRFSNAQEIFEYLKKVQKGQIEVPAEVVETEGARIQNVEHA